jgi:site-specific DNA-methyltransferase (adenine-specific)
MKYLKDIKDWKECINQVVQGDCLEGMKLIPDKSIDAIICDLPYGTTDCSWDSVIPWDKLWEQYKRIVKDNSPIVLFGSQPFTTDIINSNREWYRHCWYMEKPKGANFATTSFMPLKVIEEVLVFSKKKAKYNPQKVKLEKSYKRNFENNKRDSKSANLAHSKIKEKDFTHTTPRNLIYASTDGDGRIHPTQKPINILEYLILTYSDSDSLILDNCMGSWTTARACKNLGRNFIGFELEQKYCEIGEKRLEQLNLF